MAIDVVTADGEKRHCDKTTNTELYWAARGSGPGKPFAHSEINIFLMLFFLMA